MNTNHILFVASGAFHSSKPADLVPELQGRLPIRVELHALGEAEFVRILMEPEFNLIRQQVGTSCPWPSHSCSPTHPLVAAPCRTGGAAGGGERDVASDG